MISILILITIWLPLAFTQNRCGKPPAPPNYALMSKWDDEEDHVISFYCPAHFVSTRDHRFTRYAGYYQCKANATHDWWKTSYGHCEGKSPRLFTSWYLNFLYYFKLLLVILHVLLGKGNASVVFIHVAVNALEHTPEPTVVLIFHNYFTINTPSSFSLLRTLIILLDPKLDIGSRG